VKRPVPTSFLSPALAHLRLISFGEVAARMTALHEALPWK